jgi:hypothetical protein
VAVIRQFQPFKGADWAGQLRDFDNASKHREILSVHVDLSAGAVLQLTEYRVGGELGADGAPVPEGVQMYLKGPVDVLLPEGLPLMDMLRNIQTQVGIVLLVFTQEFK